MVVSMVGTCFHDLFSDRPASSCIVDHDQSANLEALDSPSCRFFPVTMRESMFGVVGEVLMNHQGSCAQSV